MFRLDADLKVYLHCEAVDFRKSINGLAAFHVLTELPCRAAGAEVNHLLPFNYANDAAS